jgi:hypothetical protein
MMNVLENKKKAMAQDALHTSLERQLNAAANIKPSLDAFAQIGHTDLEKPFLEMNNFRLSEMNDNLVSNNNIQNQIQTIQNDVFNSNNVAQIVAMKYNNSNGNVNGMIHSIQANSLDGKNFNVKEEVISLPTKEKVIKSFTINIDNNEGSWINNNNSKNKQLTNSNIYQNEEGEEVYNGVVSIEPQEKEITRGNNLLQENKKSNMEKAFSEMMGNMRTNKIMILVFIFAVILVVFFLRK